LDSVIRIFDFARESCQIDEDDREMKAKLLQMGPVYTEWINVLGEDQLE